MFSLFDLARGNSGQCTVSSNIQQYLAQASLPKLRLAPCTPPMPPEKHKTHRNRLSIRQERYRALHLIHRIKSPYVDRLTLEFVRKHIPSKPVAVVEDVSLETEVRPSVPCEGYDIQEIGHPPLRHIKDLEAIWLGNTILHTVQRVFEMIPEYRVAMGGFSFTLPDFLKDNDQTIFRYFMWEKGLDAAEPSCSTNSADKRIKLILAYQPPWILSPRDIEHFAATRALPSFEDHRGGEQERLNSAHKVWGKLWDICNGNDCPWFVLTNYNQWVFGGFSQSWSHGFTTGVKQAYPPGQQGDKKTCPKAKQSISRSPTILEYLTYWMVSSMDLPDSFTLPQVLEMVDLEMAIDNDPDSLLPQQQIFSDPVPYEQSESTWDGKDEGFHSEVASSAGVRIDLESDSGNTPPPNLNENWQEAPAFVVVAKDKDRISTWVRNIPGLPIGNPIQNPSIQRTPSPVRSEWSEMSYASKRPLWGQAFIIMGTYPEEVYELDYGNMDSEK